MRGAMSCGLAGSASCRLRADKDEERTAERLVS